MSVPLQNMTVHEQQRMKGENLMAEAEQKLTIAQGKKSKAGTVEEICDLYVKAGNAFKMAKEWDRAGLAFSKAADLQLGNGRKLDAGINYMEAAKCYKKVSSEDCEKCLLKAAEIYSDAGRSESVGKQLLTLAELYEEQGNSEKAVEYYQSAADMFSDKELTSKTTKCLLGVATHSATLGNFERAEEIFERLGEQSLSNKLLKYTAGEKFTKAGLCRLARNPRDGDGMIQKIEEWKVTCPAFADSRESKWLTKMAEACQKEDIDAFNEAIRAYKVASLAKWEENILNSIRGQIGPDLR